MTNRREQPDWQTSPEQSAAETGKMLETGETLQETVTFGPTGQEVRRTPRDGEWLYAVDDVIGALLPDEGLGAWDELRARLLAEGFRQVDARVVEAPLKCEDGAPRPTRLANAATLLRILEAISGPAAEAGKQWLARAGAERLREEEDPAIVIERARRLYARQGYPRDWTQRRLQGITLRQRLAREWAARGAQEGSDYAALTDALSQGTFGMPVEAHKAAKGLKASQSLRDSMTAMELLLMNLAEETALTLSQTRDSQGVEALLRDTQEASAISGATRRAIESRIGRTLITPANYRALRQQTRASQASQTSQTSQTSQAARQGPSGARRARVYLGPPLANPPQMEAQQASQEASAPTAESAQQPASDTTA